MPGFKTLADYCGGNGNPLVAQSFVPGRGWENTERLAATPKFLAGLRRLGVTKIAVEVEPGTTRLADFALAEIRAGGKVGGSLA